MSAKNGNNDHRLTFLSALLGGTLTVVGAWDRFGLSGALMLVAVLFLSVGLLFVSERSQRFSNYWTSAKQFGQRPRHFFVVAASVFTIGIILFVSDVASIRFMRKHLPLEIPNLPIKDVQILSMRFPSQLTGIEKSGEDAMRKEHASAALLKWAGGFTNTVKGESLYYVESESIPVNCDDVRVSCIIPKMFAQEVAAYLVSPNSGDLLWQRPTMRKQFHFFDANRITVVLEKPNEGDRLVLFIYAASFTSDTDPKDIRDAAEPDDLFRNHYFEFE